MREPVPFDEDLFTEKEAQEAIGHTRPANREERRRYIKTLPRNVRLAYGFGRNHHRPPGFFIPPARPRS